MVEIKDKIHNNGRKNYKTGSKKAKQIMDTPEEREALINKYLEAGGAIKDYGNSIDKTKYKEKKITS